MKEQIMTNADKIRSMTDKELARFLKETISEEGDNLFKCSDMRNGESCFEDCTECYLKYLKQREQDDYISRTDAMIAVQNVLMGLGYEPLGDVAEKFFVALENVKNKID